MVEATKGDLDARVGGGGEEELAGGEELVEQGRLELVSSKHLRVRLAQGPQQLALAPWRSRLRPTPHEAKSRSSRSQLAVASFRCMCSAAPVDLCTRVPRPITVAPRPVPVSGCLARSFDRPHPPR